MIVLERMKEESKIIHSVDDKGDREEEQEGGSKEKKEEDDSRGDKQNKYYQGKALLCVPCRLSIASSSPNEADGEDLERMHVRGI
jgi:hypothetical protein